MMKEIIHVLPESVANQIAAGEVIQRPASVVKELVENALDAGATHVDVILKDAGRTLIQVSDNGSGMGKEDALRCFERHATSKISSADDLFQLHTKGFRGEALASIAAIAHVDLKTRMEGEEVGVHVCMEGTRCTEQSECVCAKGTTFMVKNLFFNVPARRNFLKSDNVEFNNVLDEFLRIVLAAPQVSFSLYHNDKQIYDLPKTVLKQRLVSVFGNSCKGKLLPVHQDSQVVRIDGFVGTPASAKKTKGEQYLFVNQRYFRHPYFHHAIQSAMADLLPSDHYISYFLYFEVDPSKIDVNIHPTKIEVKFQEEKIIYSILHAAIRHAVGMYNISSNIDFDNVSPIDFSMVSGKREIVEPQISYNPTYNPFHAENGKKSSTSKEYPAFNAPKAANDSWRQIYETLKENTPSAADLSVTEKQLEMDGMEPQGKQEQELSLFQLDKSYIVAGFSSVLFLIQQDAASERILYERFMQQMERKEAAAVQKLLFPESVTFSPQDAETVRGLLPDFKFLGFDMEPFGRNVMIVHGVPADFQEQEVQKTLEQLLETYKGNLMSLKSSRKANLARSMAATYGLKKGKILQRAEMESLVRQLFQCESSLYAPSGKKVYVRYDEGDLSKLFKSPH
ncbi:MAG: DNA mismatch repair endonuclease MutL [Bacteroidales bacterium]|nr:DNA mismatch repair endonuclease MutL [Bacteroidales bacterium]